MKEFVQLQRPSVGDQVAVVSPSAGLPGLFPWVQDVGLERLEAVFGLKWKEYPTTRQMDSSLEDRARDLMDAFADPINKAIISSIGGEGSIKLLKYLDPKVFIDNPKPFFGYSDITHIINYLWNLGIPAFYGGAIMTQFAMQSTMDDFTVEYLKKALFEKGEIELRHSEMYNDEGLDWSDKTNLERQRKQEPNQPWFWDGTSDAEGILWGGCVESLVAQFAVGKYLPKDADLSGAILYLETAEDLPEPWLVQYVLTGMGERGWLDKFKAILVGRAKAWEFDKRNTAEEKAEYRKEQQEVILSTVREYNSTIPIIQNLDFGHTDPQFLLPSGQLAKVDSSNHRIFVTY